MSCQYSTNALMQIFVGAQTILVKIKMAPALLNILYVSFMIFCLNLVPLKYLMSAFKKVFTSLLKEQANFILLYKIWKNCCLHHHVTWHSLIVSLISQSGRHLSDQSGRISACWKCWVAWTCMVTVSHSLTDKCYHSYLCMIRCVGKKKMLMSNF